MFAPLYDIWEANLVQSQSKYLPSIIFPFKYHPPSPILSLPPPPSPLSKPRLKPNHLNLPNPCFVFHNVFGAQPTLVIPIKIFHGFTLIINERLSSIFPLLCFIVNEPNFSLLLSSSYLILSKHTIKVNLKQISYSPNISLIA